MPVRNQTRKKAARQTPVFEWVTGALGMLLVSGTIAIMLYEALMVTPSPPDISVEVDAISKIRAGYVVTFTARNTGVHAAADVRIEGNLVVDGKTVETSEATLDYIPGRSRRAGGLFFRLDPRGPGLDIRAKGYRRP